MKLHLDQGKAGNHLRAPRPRGARDPGGPQHPQVDWFSVSSLADHSKHFTGYYHVHSRTFIQCVHGQYFFYEAQSI